jgi:hypothetical protein
MPPAASGEQQGAQEASSFYRQALVFSRLEMGQLRFWLRVRV